MINDDNKMSNLILIIGDFLVMVILKIRSILDATGACHDTNYGGR